MNEIDAGFLEILASCANVEGEVDYTDDGWMPEDGDYTALLEKFTTTTFEKDGIAKGLGKAIFRIKTGDFDGRSFGEKFWFELNPGKMTRSIANLLRLGTCLSGRELSPSEITEACELAAAAAGDTLINLAVFSNTSKANGKVYTNLKYLSVVAGE